MALSFTAVFELFANELSVLKKGEKHLTSGDVLYFQQIGTSFLSKVRASMKKTEYNVEVRNNVLTRLCTCV
jgi:uncharacterized Zn finger protein